MGAALVDDLAHPGLLLAARRSAPPSLAGGWELPGGKVDPGEAPLDALHRETREELGVAIAVGEQLPGPRDDGTWPLGEHYRILVWLAVVTEGVPAPLEDHDALRWLARDELDAVAWLPGDLPIVGAVEARMRR